MSEENNKKEERVPFGKTNEKSDKTKFLLKRGQFLPAASEQRTCLHKGHTDIFKWSI